MRPEPVEGRFDKRRPELVEGLSAQTEEAKAWLSSRSAT